jgi:hypothetical protein
MARRAFGCAQVRSQTTSGASAQETEEPLSLESACVSKSRSENSVSVIDWDERPLCWARLTPRSGAS